MTAPTRVGVVGAGWGAGLHLEGFARTAGVELTAIFSRTRGRAEQVAAQYAVPKVAGSLEELVDAVDIVSVATPPVVHPEAVLAAAAAGRHVLCDKPLALTAAQARSMVDAVHRAGVRDAAGFIWRGDPALHRLRRLLRDGDIGPLREIHSTCPLGVPVFPMNWMYDADAGGGALAQHGSHVIDRARWLVGAEVVRVHGRLAFDVADAVVTGPIHNVMEAFAWGRDHHGQVVEGPRAPVSADTGYAFEAVFDNGVRARFWESWHRPGPIEDQVVLYGEDGTLEWRGGAGLFRYRVGGRPEPVDVAVSGSGPGTPREVGLAHWARLAGRFATVIRDGAPDPDLPTLTDGWRVAAISDAVRRSHHSGGWEDV